MKTSMKVLATVAAAMAFAAPAAATITIAQFTQLGNAKIAAWNKTTGKLTVTPGILPNVRFDFNFAGADPSILTQTAFMTINAIDGAPATFDGVRYNEILGSGTIKFIRSTPAPIGVGTGTRTNLLTVTFTNASLSGFAGGTSASVFASTPSSTISYTSDFYSQFGPQDDFSLSLTSLSKKFHATAGQRLDTFSGSIGGSFATQPVPEPASWALMLAGFGLVGMAHRRRRTSVVAA